METRLLKLFRAVAETGTVAGAAAKLHVTPSAISHGLKALETDVGCLLFERTARRMLLTLAGEEFLRQINPPLAALEAATDALRQKGIAPRSRLRVGMAASVCQYLAPLVIRDLRKQCHDLELHLVTEDTPELIERVKSHDLDLVLGVKPPVTTGLVIRPAFSDELMFVLASSHPWVQGAVQLKDLLSQPIILYHRSTFTSRLLQEFFDRQGLVPSQVMEVGSIGAIKELVKLNVGISILAPWAAHHELLKRTLRVRPLEKKPLRREWVVFHAAGRRPSPLAETFYRLCRAHAQGMRLDRHDLPVTGETAPSASRRR
jgi:DNA-binding transcriptional LysR family regulator